MTHKESPTTLLRLLINDTAVTLGENDCKYSYSFSKIEPKTSADLLYPSRFSVLCFFTDRSNNGYFEQIGTVEVEKLRIMSFKTATNKGYRVWDPSVWIFKKHLIPKK